MKALQLIGAGLALVGAAQAQSITINEVRIDQSSTDNDEYFELTGMAGASLDGMTYIVLGDSSLGSGVVESVTDLTGSAIGASGFFVAAESTFTIGVADLTATLDFENSDNVTHMLVSGFTGSIGDDLDTDDDGVLETTPWTAIEDCVAFVENVGSGDQIYCTTTIGPDGSFVPAHIRMCDIGWQIGSFSPMTDTPGAANVCSVGSIYCDPAVMNSTMESASLSASGSPIAGSNDLTLTVTDLPTNQFAYFLGSMTQANVPMAGGSDGTLCVGGTIARFVSQISNSGIDGLVAIDVDLTAIPANPSVAVIAGDTWNFQCWYRDGMSSNFSDAVEILFQ